MQVPQPKTQSDLASTPKATGETRSDRMRGTETCTAKTGTEHPVDASLTMEKIVERENMKRALKQVQRNKGAPGVDGMTVKDLGDYLIDQWPVTRGQLLAGTYKPQPVRWVEIPKVSGGKRLLGIPAVIDRLIQQAAMQVLQAEWDPTFTEHSHGFRPGRSAHGAVKEAQAHIAAGNKVVVDIDLEKFFDRVNHDILMALVARRVRDQRILKLIRRYLTAGAMMDGLASPTEEGVPQGGPLSPLLSNLMLDQLDKELEKRGHHFVRYADDANIYVCSRRAGERVLASVERFLSRKLKLRVNTEKSAVDKPVRRKFLSFSFVNRNGPKRRIAPEAMMRMKRRVRKITQRSRGRSLEQIVEELSIYLRGWRGYFGICETPTTLRDADRWIRRRLRSLIWKQWRHSHKRFTELGQRGVSRELALQTVGSPHGPWRLSNSPALAIAMGNNFFKSLGLIPLLNEAKST
jgi:RNA-directed DNA polymerase